MYILYLSLQKRRWANFARLLKKIINRPLTTMCWLSHQLRSKKRNISGLILNIYCSDDFHFNQNKTSKTNNIGDAYSGQRFQTPTDLDPCQQLHFPPFQFCHLLKSRSACVVKHLKLTFFLNLAKIRVRIDHYTMASRETKGS